MKDFGFEEYKYDERSDIMFMGGEDFALAWLD